MRIEYAIPTNLCIEGLSEALHQASLTGFSGVSQCRDKVFLEFPERNQALDADEAAAVEALLNDHPASWESVRQQRQPLLAEADWQIERAEDKGQDTTDLRAYRQALRDMTKQPDARTAVWPARPW
jgi:hypothetical protein